jgi:hypothetical protein
MTGMQKDLNWGPQELSKATSEPNWTQRRLAGAGGSALRQVLPEGGGVDGSFTTISTG